MCVTLSLLFTSLFSVVWGVVEMAIGVVVYEVMDIEKEKGREMIFSIFLLLYA